MTPESFLQLAREPRVTIISARASSAGIPKLSKEQSDALLRNLPLLRNLRNRFVTKGNTAQ